MIYSRTSLWKSDTQVLSNIRVIENGSIFLLAIYKLVAPIEHFLYDHAMHNYKLSLPFKDYEHLINRLSP